MPRLLSFPERTIKEDELQAAYHLQKLAWAAALEARRTLDNLAARAAAGAQVESEKLHFDPMLRMIFPCRQKGRQA